MVSQVISQQGSVSMSLELLESLQLFAGIVNDTRSYFSEEDEAFYRELREEESQNDESADR
jgi:hypothetical protein